MRYMEQRRNVERMLDDGLIDFFVVEQYFDGIVNMNAEHNHDHYEIFYMKKGNRVFYQNGIPYKLGTEHLCVIPPNYQHMTTSLLENLQELVFVGFSKDYFDGFIPGKTTADLFSNSDVIVHIKSGEENTVLSMFNKLNELYNNEEHDELTKAKIQSALFDLIYNYSDYQCSENEEIYDKEGNMSLKVKYMMMARYIKKHLNEKITLDLLEEKFGISKYEISRNFKDYCGSFFVDYLNTIRMDYAQSLLTNTNARVEDVAMSCGFESLSHFSKTFKKYEGMSPKQFSVYHKALKSQK